MYEDELLAGRVLDIIAAHDAGTPLFLFWAMHVVRGGEGQLRSNSACAAAASFPSPQVHGPLEVPQAYVNKFSNITDQPRRLYTAMVNFADDKVCGGRGPLSGASAAILFLLLPLLLLPPQVGAVVAALKSRGMWNNTLWVTSADNGGPISGGANNYPLRGGKFTNFEGGIRVNGG